MSHNPSPSPPGAPDHGVAVILAAGRSTRMRSRIPKPLHPLCGLPLTRHVINSCRDAGFARVIVVVGFEAEAVRQGLGADVEYAVQKQPLGTGDAARSAAPHIAGYSGPVAVLAGDVPLLSASTLRALRDQHVASGAALTLLTAILDDATGYGRIVRDAEGRVAMIVEEKDATDSERLIREWNPSIYCFDGHAMLAGLKRLRSDNAQRELYLTDVVGLMVRDGARVDALRVSDADETLGVNSRVDLAQVTGILRRRVLTGLMLEGVTVVDAASTYVDATVKVGADTVLEPGAILLGSTTIGEECQIGPNTRIRDSRIGDRCTIAYSQITESKLASGVRVGPFAHLRPGTEVDQGARIGDFVELKNTRLGAGASASHLAYLGDSDIGAGANIGAGAVTCNYDGARKHRTQIGDGAFVGSNATLVAPVVVGGGAYVAAGSTITADVPADALAIARSHAAIKEGWAARRRRDQEA
ncbi:MAG TPA: bifunctional UDP-N-acetylglucosamine diphosphorylase/glucosamine-1-phosphate N-acetyltransferase GlmU [Chthonomonadales bacterium]|nr:bifunctional UDP-N-acetylglucosamine diphosphorylase/glucosamine-1-phosphate N-acetyltransferase GlmU [Chthonomonadales bacterium]